MIFVKVTDKNMLAPFLWASVYMAAWRSGNDIGRINEATLRRARHTVTVRYLYWAPI